MEVWLILWPGVTLDTCSDVMTGLWEAAVSCFDALPEGKTQLEDVSKMLAKITIQIARLEGFEPTTPGSEDRCSIPLSYRRIIKKGERWDLNPRSPGPQPGALTTGLRSP